MMISPVTAGKEVAGMTGDMATELGSDFMTLLVAQLQAQDPMNPLTGNELMSQLVQLQSLSELTQIRAAVAGTSGSEGLGPAVGLVGRNVEWLDPLTSERLSGIVSRLEAQSDGSFALVVGQARLAMAQVLAVS